MRHTTEIFIERSKKKFGKKFSYPNTDYINANINIKLHCNHCNNDFETSPNRHLRSKAGSCLSCQKKLIGNIKRKPIGKFIEESIDNFGENKFLYGNFIYKNKNTPSELTCIECDISFNIAPKNHLQSESGCCPLCGNGKMTKEIWLLKANKVHPNNEYSYKTDFVYTDCYTKLDIYCNHCQEWFKQNTTDHLSGRGCNTCGCRKRAEKRLSNKDEFIEKAIKIHGGGLYDYSPSIYIKSSENIDIKCNKCMKIFTLTPNKHLGGRGCNKCSNSGTSKPAREWIKFISLNKNIQHFDSDEGEYKIHLTDGTHYKADGYDKDTNTIYEFHGDFWHGNPDKHKMNDVNPRTKTTYGYLYLHTLIKQSLCIGLGYNYVSIWGNEWDKIKLSVIKIQRVYRRLKCSKV